MAGNVPRDSFWRLPRTVRAHLLVVVLVVLAPILLLRVGFHLERAQLARQADHEAGLRLAELVATGFEEYVQGLLRQELVVGRLMASMEPSRLDLASSHLAESARGYPGIHAFYWVDPTGRIVASSRPESIGLEVAGQSYFHMLAEGREWSVSSLLYPSLDAEPLLAIARAVRGDGDVLLGVVVAEVDPRALAEVVIAVRADREAFKMALLDGGGHCLYCHPTEDLSGRIRDQAGRQSPPPDGTALPSSLADRFIGTAQEMVEGRQQVVAAAAVGFTDWTVLARDSDGVFEALAFRDLLLELGLLVLAAAVGLATSASVGRRIIAPIGLLKEHARAVGCGELTHRVPVGGPAELEDLAESLNQLAEQVAVREALRDEYVQTISHDLRAPLTVIQGHAQMIQRAGEGGDLVRKSADAIVTGARRMDAMIQDLVDATRLESGQLQLKLTPVDMRSFLLDLCERLRGGTGGERIRVDLPESVGVVRADVNRLERVLMNLITNALKYSHPDTQVTVALTQGRQDVVVSVSDQGPGIPPEELPLLFQRFHRAPQTGNHREGLGLGLYITRGLVEAHGGRIRAKSRPGQGSVFEFTIPLPVEESDGENVGEQAA